MDDPENIAESFHEAYERLAPDFGWVTRESTATRWDQIPEENRSLMIAVVEELLERGVIRGG